MKLRSALLLLVFSLMLGSSGPVFAADANTARADKVTSIQNQCNPLFDAQYADAVKSYAEKELGEFESTLGRLETQAAKFKTITCIKAKQVKKVSGLTPKCPKGCKKK